MYVPKNFLKPMLRQTCKKIRKIRQLETLKVVATWIFDPPNQLTWMAK